jgi:hypothetical protein
MLPNTLRPLLPALAIALLAAACGGARVGPVSSPVTCSGEAELVVANQQALRARVLEHSTIAPTRVLGEIPGRGSRSYPVRQVTGVYYAVEIVDTGELLAAEAAHPRGVFSRGATLQRRCVN